MRWGGTCTHKVLTKICFGETLGWTHQCFLKITLLWSSYAALAPSVSRRKSFPWFHRTNNKETSLASLRNTQKCSTAALIWSFLQTARDKHAMMLRRWSLAVYKYEHSLIFGSAEAGGLPNVSGNLDGTEQEQI